MSMQFAMQLLLLSLVAAVCMTRAAVVSECCLIGTVRAQRLRREHSCRSVGFYGILYCE